MTAPYSSAATTPIPLDFANFEFTIVIENLILDVQVDGRDPKKLLLKEVQHLLLLLHLM